MGLKWMDALKEIFYSFLYGIGSLLQFRLFPPGVPCGFQELCQNNCTSIVKYTQMLLYGFEDI